MSEQFAPGEVLFDVIELIDQPRVQAYARAAKDDNAIHVDTEAAQAVGLEGPVAHGMLSVGIALGHVMGGLPRCQSVLALRNSVHKTSVRSPRRIGSSEDLWNPWRSVC